MRYHLKFLKLHKKNKNKYFVAPKDFNLFISELLKYNSNTNIK